MTASTPTLKNSGKPEPRKSMKYGTGCIVVNNPSYESIALHGSTNADPDTPILKQAKVEYAKLQ